MTGRRILIAAAFCAALASAPALPPSSPERLSVRGREFADSRGVPVRLRGANLEGATEADADLLVSLGMNFARLRVSFEPPNTVGSGADERFSSAYLETVGTWIDALASRGVWTLLELRSRDELTNGAELYTVGSPAWNAYKRAWLDLAELSRGRGRIAGYGLLAEPSANRRFDRPEAALVAFQKSLMDAISREAGDGTTVFFVGPDWNYDTLQYRHDLYYTALADYRGRLAYEVNFLVPKPWIKDGSGPDGVPAEALRYPQPAAEADFSAFLLPAPGEKLSAERDAERVFSRRSAEAALFPRLLTPAFIDWYLAPAFAFSERFGVPLCIDQFGASVEAAGGLSFEEDLVRRAESRGVAWARWSLNAGSRPRMIAGNPAVAEFYRTLTASLDRPR